MSLSVVAIIPAFNEEATIASVVAVLKSSPLIQEVIVVSDGSTDQTADFAQRAGARVYQKTKGGKGQALLHGLRRTQAEVVVFCDADLRGLTVEHLRLLLDPVLSGRLQMHVGRRDRGALVNAISRHLPLISGERAMRREVMEQIPAHFLQGYMVESSLNYFCRSRHLAYGSVLLPGLSIRRKFEKVGWLRASGQYARMSVEVLRAMVMVRVARWRGLF